MPRNSGGTYTLPQSAFVPGTTISSAAVNSDFSDIATALTQSLATTGVSSMTGQLLAASGNVSTPGVSFSSGTSTGFFLAGTDQIGWASAGVLAATFNNDLSVSWLGNASWTGTTIFGGAATFNSTSSFVGAQTFSGAMTLNTVSYTFGSGAPAAWWAGIATPVDVQIIIDGLGNVINTGQKGQIHIPYPMTITKWWVMADQSGSITVDILRANNAVPSSSIVGGGNSPSLSSSQFTSAAPSGWTATTLAKDDFVAFNVTGSPSSVQRITVTLTCTRTG